MRTTNHIDTDNDGNPTRWLFRLKGTLRELETVEAELASLRLDLAYKWIQDHWQGADGQLLPRPPENINHLLLISTHCPDAATWLKLAYSDL